MWTTTFAIKPDPNPEFGLEILFPFPDSHKSAPYCIYSILKPEYILSLWSRVILSAFVGRKSPFLRDLQLNFLNFFTRKQKKGTYYNLNSNKVCDLLPQLDKNVKSFMNYINAGGSFFGLRACNKHTERCHN